MATEILRPNAAGDECGISKEVGATCPNHYQNVDEEVADDYTTNNRSQTGSWERDLYNLPAHSGTGTINKITVFFKIYRKAKPVIKSDSTITEGTEQDVGDSWILKSQEWATNPADGEAWEWADIDALQVGVAVKAVAPSYSCCTQVYVEVDYTAITEKNVSDTGSGVDATPSIAVSLSLADTGAGVDTVPALSPTIPAIPDEGLGTDLIAAIEAALTLAETGSGVDAVNVLYYITFVNVSDVGEGADVISLAITIPAIEDSGVGVDKILGEYTKVIADQMYSSEWLGVAASMILSELAEGADNVAVQVTPIIADTGEGLESVVINASLNVAEVGSGQEAITITATIPIAETGAGADNIVAAVSITIADTGQGVDAILKRVLQLVKMLVRTRSKARMTVQTRNKARITIQLRGGGKE